MISDKKRATGVKRSGASKIAEPSIKITACYHEFGSRLIFRFFWGDLLGSC